MPGLPPAPQRTHLDQDTDDVFQARANIDETARNLGYVIDYLAGLFGTDGVKATALATLTSGQSVTFPAGTRMWFFQATPPVGWVTMALDQGRYLYAQSGATGGQAIGDYGTVLPSTATALWREALPNITLTGVTDWHQGHAHATSVTNVSYNPPFNFFGTSYQGPDSTGITLSAVGTGTSPDGQHYHNFSVPLGGEGHGHTHNVSMAGYRPAGLQGIIGEKS